MNNKTDDIILESLISGLNEQFNIIEDMTVKVTFSEFIRSFFSKEFDFKNKSRIKIHSISIELISKYIKNKTLDDFNWTFLCIFMNDDNLIKFIDSDNINIDSINKISNTSKQLLKSYILYLIYSTDYNSIGLNELQKYNHLIRQSYSNSTKFYLSSDHRDILQKYILSSYPLNSNIKTIYQVYNNDNTKAYNLNLNTANTFLLNLIKGFIDKLAYGTRVNASHKIFYYYFEESFGSFKAPDKIQDFTLDTFNQQIKFYGYIIDKLNFNGLLKPTSKTSSAVVLPQRIIIQFYIYLIGYIKNSNINYNIFKNSWITEKLLKSTNFLRVYTNGFNYVYYNKLEDVPSYDKWWLDPGEDAKKSTKLNISYATIDFTKVSNDILKQKFKEWIWYGNTNSNIIRRMGANKTIIDFLDFKYNYEKSLNNVNYLYTEKNEFPIELFYKFRIFYENKFSNKVTLGERFIDLRSFLNFISKECYINKKCFKYLIIKGSSSDDFYGCPITPEDFQLILTEFKMLQDQFDYGILLTNIFYLCSTTNLRPSEILSLQRNCIIYKDEDGNGTIELMRKTSSGTFIHQELDAENIKLIESSIQISNQWVKYLENDYDKNFIFIGKTTSNSFGENYKRLNNVFSDKFRNIILKLDSKLENYYTPYNLRDTFINIVYDNFQKYNEADIDKLQRITGNSYNTVMKYYRRKFAIREYVEVMSKIVISDVDINGNILEDESSINDKYSVNNDLGVCNSSSCSFENTMNYDSENICLFCNNFITSLSRIQSFEKKILSIRKKLDSINASTLTSQMEKNILLADLKLCCGYLTQMLELKNNSY